MPLEIASSSISPDKRVSLPIIISESLPSFLKKQAIDFPYRAAPSGVKGEVFATPLIPSVPKSLGLFIFIE